MIKSSGSDLGNFSNSLGSSGVEKNVIPADAGIQACSR